MSDCDFKMFSNKKHSFLKRKHYVPFRASISKPIPSKGVGFVTSKPKEKPALAGTGKANGCLAWNS
jgi:hypothetical protein